MAFKLSELLNPAPASGATSPTRQTHRNSVSHSTSVAEDGVASASTAWGASHLSTLSSYEAADALTALATSGAPSYPSHHASSGAPTASNYSQYPPNNAYDDSRRQSSLGASATPVEPSPPLPQNPFSPSLSQYHHDPKSPEQQRRQSILAQRASPPIQLAPIQSLTHTLSEQVEDSQRRTSYGHDASQILSPSAGGQPQGSGGLNIVTENREPDYIRNTPTTTQIREPLPTPQSTDMAPSMQRPAAAHESAPSPPATIKHEPSATPREITPARSQKQSTPQKNGDVDLETLKAIAEIKSSELGLRGQHRESSKPADASAEDPSIPAAAPSKKRPAPKSAAATKKGTAKKPPAKKRKTEPESESVARRSETPSAKAIKNSKPSNSATPLAGSSPGPEPHTAEPHLSPDEDDAADDDVSDPDQLFCICRKPDNHTWMIGCDGGCDDWFHGKCIKMREEDSVLIDKYICPNCEARGIGRTTWKAMCRREGCRKPARLKKGSASKYCSDACGQAFFREAVEKSRSIMDGHGGKGANKSKGAKKATNLDSFDGVSEYTSGLESDDDLGPHGGIIRPKDIKALATSVKDIDAFRRLGSGVLSPPATVSPEQSTFPSDGPEPQDVPTSSLESNTYTLTSSETARVQAIAEEKDNLRTKKSLLKDKEKFIQLAREHAARYAEGEGIKPKEVCGYDTRLTCSEEEFRVWRDSAEGKAAFELGTLECAPGQGNSAETLTNGTDEAMTNGVDSADKTKDDDKKTFCTKKRCNRHAQWQKLAVQDVRFEEATLGDEMRKLDAEEKGIRERAGLRFREEKMSSGVDGEMNRRREGWVEVV